MIKKTPLPARFTARIFRSQCPQKNNPLKPMLTSMIPASA
jgi:hypothetical protein